MPEKDCISIQQCFVTGSQTFALKCFRDLKWNNLPWSISDYRFGIVGRYNLLQGSDGQSLLNNKYTLGQIRWHILKQIISPDVKISFLFCSKNKKMQIMSLVFYIQVSRCQVLPDNTLSAILSRKHCLFPNPSADRQTLSPVPVQDRHTMSSWTHSIYIL